MAITIGAIHDRKIAPSSVDQDKKPGRISKHLYKSLSLGDFKLSALATFK